MKRALSLLVFAAATPALASPLDGLWRTPEDGGIVRLYDCGDGVCGKVVDSEALKRDPAMPDRYNKDPALRTRTIKGLEIVHHVVGGPQEWKGGSVYNPNDGGTYRGSLKLVGPDTLKLTGCIIFPLCKSQTWTRVK